jgi:hypothetical protein
VYSSTGKLPATADRSGLANEEVYTKLAAGTWYLTVDAPHGKVSATPYVVRFTSLADGLVLLSKKELGTGAKRELGFEVLNNTSRSIDGVGWTIKNTAAGCSANPFGGICSSPGAAFQYRVIPPRARASFFTTDVVGLSSYTFAVQTGSPTTRLPKLAVAVTSTEATSKGYTITGTLKNNGTQGACAPTPVRNAYDARGGLLGNYEVWVSGHFEPGAGYTWKTSGVPAVPKGTVRTV